MGHLYQTCRLGCAVAALLLLSAPPGACHGSTAWASPGRGAGRGPLPRRLLPLLPRTYQVQVRRGVGFVGTTAGLRLVSLRDPSRPRALSTMVIPGSVQSIALSATMAYVASGPHGVVLVDVTRPRHPVRVGRVDTPGSASSVAIKGTTLYVADGSFGVGVYDVTHPRRIRRLAHASMRCYARDLVVHGRWLIVACGRQGLVVLPTHRPRTKKGRGGRGAHRRAWPGKLIHMALPGEARHLAVGPGRTLYVAAGEAGFHVLDARRPRHLKRVATAKVKDFARGVSAWGNLVAVADGEGGVHLFGCGRRTRPRLLASYRTRPNRSANRVLLRRGLLLVAYDAAGLHILGVKRRRLRLRAVFPPKPRKRTRTTAPQKQPRARRKGKSFRKNSSPSVRRR